MLELSERRELAGAPESTTYGFRYSGGDMSPAIRDGWTVWVGRKFDPTPGDIIVLERADRDSAERYIVIFVNQTADEWIVQKVQPDDVFKISKAEWPIAKEVAVIAKYSR